MDPSDIREARMKWLLKGEGTQNASTSRHDEEPKGSGPATDSNMTLHASTSRHDEEPKGSGPATDSNMTPHPEVQAVKSCMEGFITRMEVMFAQFQSEFDDMRTSVKNDVTELTDKLNSFKSNPQMVVSPSRPSAVGTAVVDSNGSAAFKDDIPDFPAICEKYLPKETDCGVCHMDCKFNMQILGPCGHFPFCLQCIGVLKEKKSCITEVSCPNCNTKLSGNWPLHKLKRSEMVEDVSLG